MTKLPGGKNIRKQGDWQVDLSCLQMRHINGVVIGFSVAPDGSYTGRILEGYPQFDQNPDTARKQVRWFKVLLDEAGEAFEEVLSSNLH